MKNTKKCPKCSGEDILVIRGLVRDSGDNFIPAGFLNNIPVHRYVCGNCGYTEEWIDHKDDLESLKDWYRRKWR